MITINYTKDGMAHYDHDIEEFAKDIIRHAACNPKIDTSTGNIVRAFTMLIAEGVVSHEDVRFLFDGEPVFVNEYGACHDWPDGWCDCEVKMSHRQLIAATMKWKAERKTVCEE